MSFLQQLLQPIIKWYTNKNAQKSLPNYNEHFTIEGIKDTVHISRDEWGVPHIQTKNQRDLFFAQGFIHAQDRLFQMELLRRTASGRLSEIFGDIALDADRTLRTLGIRRVAIKDEKLLKEDDLFQKLEAYSQGVNAYLAQGKKLPTEFKLLKFDMQAWTTLDSLAIARLLNIQMCVGWQHELLRLQLVQVLGPEKAAELFPQYPHSSPVSLENNGECNLHIDRRLQAFKGPFIPKTGASNNWVVAADKMQTKSAVLCNDPHLFLSIPSIWYENHLIAPDFETTGVSIPGMPLVLIGHNRKMAWGITLSYADVQDCFIEEFTSENGKQYKVGQSIKKASHLEEKIYIKGKKNPHIERVIYTHRGPIISNAMDGLDPKQKISLQSQCLQEGYFMKGFYALNQTEDWNSFCKACALIESPSLNIVYADTDDNIGYYMTGKIPVRAKNKDLSPTLGYKDQSDWKGFVPFEEMPHAYNPQKGYLYTCNHKIVGEKYPYYLGDTWMNGYRAERLEELFASKQQYSLDDFKAWQMDLKSMPGEKMQKIVEQYKDLSLTASAQDVLTRFLQWDTILSTDSCGGAIYQVLKLEISKLLLEKNLSPLQFQVWKGAGFNPHLFGLSEFMGHDTPTLLRLLSNKNSAWFTGELSIEQCIVQSLENTHKYLTQKLGSSPSAWSWGALHQLTLMHPLGVQPPLDKLLNIGPIALPGDTDTLCQIAHQPENEFTGKALAASFRQIIDLGNFSSSLSILPGGSSSNHLSEFYANQLEDWKQGKFKKMIWTKKQIEEHQRYSMQLVPKV